MLLAEGGQVEVGPDFGAFRGNYVDGRGIGGEGICGEFQAESGAGQVASLTVPRALQSRFAGKTGWPEGFLALQSFYLKILPEIVRAEPVGLRLV